MPFAHKIDGKWVEITGAFVTANGSYPAGWSDAATSGERETAGVVEVAEPSTTPPAGKVFQGWTEALVDVAGGPSRVAIFGNPPPPPVPTEVPMWKVMRVLILRGEDGDLQGYLDAIPGAEGKIIRSDFARAPNLVVDSPFADAAKAAMGWTDADYLARIHQADAVQG